MTVPAPRGGLRPGRGAALEPVCLGSRGSACPAGKERRARAGLEVAIPTPTRRDMSAPRLCSPPPPPSSSLGTVTNFSETSRASLQSGHALSNVPITPTPKTARGMQTGCSVRSRIWGPAPIPSCTSFGPKGSSAQPHGCRWGPRCPLRLSPREAQTHRGGCGRVWRGVAGEGPGGVSSAAGPVATRQRGPWEGRAVGTEPWAGAAGAAALPFGRTSGREESPPPTAALSDGGPLPPLSLSPPGFHVAPHVCRARGPRGRGAARTPDSRHRAAEDLEARRTQSGRAPWLGAGEGGPRCDSQIIPVWTPLCLTLQSLK